jgi:hypothetical protein
VGSAVAIEKNGMTIHISAGVQLDNIRHLDDIYRRFIAVFDPAYLSN